MKVSIVLAVLATAYAAPIQEGTAGKTAEDMIHTVSKRTDEQIFFGNQQNAPRVKKADPETDSRGLVRALPADEIRDVNEETSASEETQPTEAQEPPKNPVIQNQNSHPEDESVVSEKQDQDTADKTTDEEVLKEDQLLKAEMAGEAEDSENSAPLEEGSGSVSEPASDEMSYDYLQKLYNEASDRMPYDFYYPEYYVNYRKRRNTPMNMDDEEDVVKRNHRAKRDLGYDDLSDSYFPSTFNDDQYYNEVLRKRVVEAALDEAMARELAPLLENYQNEESEYPERYDVPSYMEYLPESAESFEQSPYDDDRWETEDTLLGRPYDAPYRQSFRPQAPSLVPIKRQMLSMVPGSRRKRFNYPYSQEPGSHWGAFVESEKRGQEAAYERLYRLARALATRRSPYTAYFGDDEYKKK